MRAMTAMMLVANVTAPAMAATAKDGVDAWQRGDYATAVSVWRPLADQGDADAAFNLAQAYKLGRGVPTDLAKAKSYYGKAARAGHIQAAAAYGLLLFQDGDRAGAMPWIKQASDAGDIRAQYVYATALFNGDFAPKDWPKAYALMTHAAAAGLAPATTSLAQMDQFMSPADRQKGMSLAAQFGSQPAPPTNRTLVTPATAIVLPPPPTPSRPSRTIVAKVDVPASSVKVGKPAKPEPKPVAIATSAGGKWQVQLGAFSSQDAARSAWNGLSGKPGLRGLSPSYEKAGAVVRLRAGGLPDKAAASRACTAAKAAGTACFPVAP